MPSAPKARSPGTGTIIVCYDGSPQAAEAIAYAGQLVPGWRAVVVVVWKPVIEEALAGPMTPPPTDHPVDVNVRARESAEKWAEVGAELAVQAGLDAEPVVLEADGPRWQAIELVAEQRDAKLIVCGTRHSGVTAALPQALTGALVAHASRPVLVVPSTKAAAERLREAEEERASRHSVARAAAEVAGRAREKAAAARQRWS
jgi:nucleotide-binding universal stress UspA family protein